MTKVEILLADLLRTMQEVSGTLTAISAKLDCIGGRASLDDVVNRIEDCTGSIVGAGRSDLSDIHNELQRVTKGLTDIRPNLD